MNAELYRIVFGLIISITAMIMLNRYLNLHAFFSLLTASLLLGLIVGKPVGETLSVMQTGFGILLQQIGFIVALGACLGIVMEKTGAMTVISQRIVRLFGPSRTVLALSCLGMIVGIPVFCDSAFIILSRLIPAIAAQAAVNPAPLALALSSGLFTSHTLVPPTPGPLAAAANFGMTPHLGLVMLTGIAGSIPVVIVSYFASRYFGRRIKLEVVPATTNPDVRNLSALIALLPLVVPIILIAASMLPATLGWSGSFSAFLAVTGHPVVALGVGLILAMSLLIRKQEKKEWPLWISEALKDAGIILLITGAGGAFGYVIKSSGLDTLLATNMNESAAGGIAFLITAFALAALLKTAQGSTTSAMIITSALLSPLLGAAGFSSPAQMCTLILAVGAGAMTVSHANDSYFWVVSQFSGLSPKDALRSFTFISLIQGLTGLLTTIILYSLL